MKPECMEVVLAFGTAVDWLEKAGGWITEGRLTEASLALEMGISTLARSEIQRFLGQEIADILRQGIDQVKDRVPLVTEIEDRRQLVAGLLDHRLRAFVKSFDRACDCEAGKVKP